MFADEWPPCEGCISAETVPDGPPAAWLDVIWISAALGRGLVQTVLGIGAVDDVVQLIAWCPHAAVYSDDHHCSSRSSHGIRNRESILSAAIGAVMTNACSAAG